MDKYSYVGNSEIETIEELYQQYLKNPVNLDESWQNFFKGYEFARQNFISETIENQSNTIQIEIIDKEFKVGNLIEAYRHRGHLFTKTNPVRERRHYTPTLDLENFGLSNFDLETVFHAGNKIGIGPARLKDIVSHLNQTYCQSIGVEYISVRLAEPVNWLKDRMEKTRNIPTFTIEDRQGIYHELKKAVGFEKFLHNKFPGQKSFSLEGGESLIPALNSVIEKGAELGIEEFIIGMSHRGRLNVLANIIQKPYENVFQEFIGKEYDSNIALGDVKYHLGYGNDIKTRTGKAVRLNLVPNPSHLEMGGAVTIGITKAKIIHKYKHNYKKIAAIQIHGDAAIAAQGINYEIIQMAKLPGYETGGTIHLVINNQVGFTTNYSDARSSIYCTDVARVTRCPVFHVNGDDAEALVYTIELALEFRDIFQRDIFIDILCYRRYGHNEGDEPRFTQPTLYKAIEKHPNPRDIYGQHLIDQGVYKEEDLVKIQKEFDNFLEAKFEISNQIEKVHIKQFLGEDWKGFKYSNGSDFLKSPDTGVEREILLVLAGKITYLPQDERFFNKVYKIVDDRKKMISDNKLDWAMCELLAYASLVNERIPVRISGQDSIRGTFAHRHASFVLEDMNETYTALEHISENQGLFTIYNSLLSEYGVLGFEYGYSLAVPDGLTIWEAQFGDFHNVAQPIIDQYISSAEEKWGLMNGIVLYLPHGFEGQGPEHSSARIERFLMLSTNENMQIVNCTTPANFFHVLRRQIKRDFRVPLIIFTPKSLLRHPKCVSSIEDLEKGRFKEVIDDDYVDIEEVRRLVFCSGKVYYDLLYRKQDLDVKDIAIVRIEQLHPFPLQQLQEIIKKYKNTLLTLWVQEEPENMGPWQYVNREFKDTELICVSRLPSGSPATGLHKLHVLSQNEIINKVFRSCDCELKNKYCGLQCVKGKSREEILKQHYYL